VTRAEWRPWLLLAPSLVILIWVFVVPLGILGRYSFYRTASGGVMVPAWTLDQYARFLLDPHHLRILGITLGLAFGVTLVTAVLGYPLAYGLARARSPRRRALGVTALLIPLMTSVVVRSYGWMILLASTGVVNASLVAAGIVSRPIQLLFTPTGVVIALSEVLLPFMVLSLPGLVSGSVLVFVLSAGAFATPRLVGGPTTDVITMLIYEQTLSLLNWPFGAAAAWVLLLLVLTLIWAQGFLLRRHATRLAGAP
jgi:putative spermidine/putrescine transport system permease protein